MSWVTVRLSGDMIVSGGVPAPAVLFRAVDVAAHDPPAPAVHAGPADGPGERPPAGTPGWRGRPGR